MEHRLTIGLFDPGMTALHRVGLAGLYMTLKQFDAEGLRFKNASWILTKRSVEIAWEGNAFDFLDPLLKRSFGISREGLVDFYAHRSMVTGDIQRVLLSECIRTTFLQQYQQNKIPKGTTNRSVSFNIDEEMVVAKYKPFVRPYAHSTFAKYLSDEKKGVLHDHVAIKSWIIPGAAERHSDLKGTEMQETPGRALALLYAPIMSLYIKILHKNKDGKLDDRAKTAILIPHITDIEQYSTAFKRYLSSPVERLFADSSTDATLSALIILRGEERIERLGITGCDAFMLGNAKWKPNQQARNKAICFTSVDDTILDFCDLAYSCFENKIKIVNSDAGTKNSSGEKSYVVFPSIIRSHVVNNIAQGHDWFAGFSRLMDSKEQAKRIQVYEKEGLSEMIEKATWPHEADKLMVEAVHRAIRARYGALAAQASSRGEPIPFDREFERMRVGLMRAKNAQTLRAELADLFARGGLNRTLQENWQDLLPLFAGDDWQRAKDLALLALASYKGRGSEEIEKALDNNGKENDQ